MPGRRIINSFDMTAMTDVGPIVTGLRRLIEPMRTIFNIYKPQTVVGGLLAIVLPGLLVVQGVASLVIQHNHFSAMKLQQADQVAKLAASRSDILAEPLWRMQYRKVQSVLDEIASTDAVTHALVIDDTGTAVASFGKLEGRLADDYLSVAQTITYLDGNHRTFAGILVIHYSTASLLAQFNQGLKQAFVVSLLASLATFVGIWWATQRVVGRPLAAISDAIVRTQQDGQWVKADTTSRNEIGHVIHAFNDMQDRRREAQDRLAHLATHDSLTGLPNRRHFEALFDETVRKGGNGNIALHFLDMDGFKKVNDTFGHEAGDRYLIEVAKRLRTAAGPDNIVTRIGGDEFLILQSDICDVAECEALAQCLASALAGPILIEGVAVSPSCCIGIAMRQASSSDVRNLRVLADIALYDAKAIGPGQIAVLTDERFRLFQRIRSLEEALPASFSAQQVSAWYQSQISLRTNRVVAVEALSRWHHPGHGLISPCEFLPLIERNRLSRRLTDVVLENVCEMIKRMHAAGQEGVRVAMNISAQELADERLATHIRDVTDRHGVPMTSLEIEITEGALIDNFAATSQIVRQLREQGVTVALDDFGTGYSSLAYLRRLPIDKLKIDKSFIRDATQNAQARAVLDTIVLLAQRLDLQLVAEGIEHPEQSLLVQLLGADIGQGYLFHRPQPMEACLDFLAATSTGRTDESSVSSEEHGAMTA